ncbi:four helix bundle protein [Crocinitomix catalasitica]|nr:four helix bundle protein [Crocinitomix catalasitica]
MKVYAKEKLAVRKASRELVVDVYRVADLFPYKAKVTLGVELKKSATSLTSYIAEGSARSDLEEQTNLLLLAYKCLVEISNNMIIAEQLNVVPPKYFELINLRIKDLAVKIDRVAKPEEN